MLDADWKKWTDVREGEFEVSDDGVYHAPSGAMFWAWPESAEPYQIDWGKAQDTEEDGAPLFDEGWIHRIAVELLRKRLS